MTGIQAALHRRETPAQKLIDESINKFCYFLETIGRDQKYGELEDEVIEAAEIATQNLRRTLKRSPLEEVAGFVKLSDWEAANKALNEYYPVAATAALEKNFPEAAQEPLGATDEGIVKAVLALIFEEKPRVHFDCVYAGMAIAIELVGHFWRLVCSRWRARLWTNSSVQDTVSHPLRCSWKSATSSQTVFWGAFSLQWNMSANMQWYTLCASSIIKNGVAT